MTLYLAIFLSSTFFVFYAKKSVGLLKYLCVFMAALIPSFFAGVRDDFIGQDMHNYVIRTWNMAASYADFFSYWKANGNEIGFCLLNFIVRQMTNDLHVYLFVHQFILILVILCCSLKLNSSRSCAFFFGGYMLFLYNMSLCAMRQCYAIAFVAYAVSFLFEENQKKKFILFLLIAFCFHNSVVFMLVLPMVFYLVKKYPQKILLIYLISIVGALMLFSGYQTSVSWLLEHGLISAKYEMYLDQTGFKVHKISLLVEFGLLLFNLLRVKKRTEWYNYAQIFLILSICMEMMGCLVETATRVVFYFMLIVMYMSSFITYDKKELRLIHCVYTFFFFVQFVYLGFTTSHNATIPYSSQILGF